MRGQEQLSLRSRLLLMVAATALTPVGAAHAQQGAAVTSEVIVTAQRRSERLQDVPLSVTAVSRDTLAAAGITTTRDLQLVTPGLRLNAGGIFMQPVIRGITTTQTYVSTEANVATYLDGVYQQSTLAAIYDLPDVEQVEVLKGPQGTLFGRNATGGAILINTRNPNLTTATGTGTVGYGRFNDYYAKGWVSMPIVQDKVAASLTLLGEHTDGWRRNLLTGNRGGKIETFLVRGKVRFVPWDGADFVLSGAYSKLSDHGSLKNTNLNGNNQFIALLPPSQIASRPNEFASNIDTRLTPKNASVSLRGTIEAGPGTLTTTTAYVDQKESLVTDGDTTPLPFAAVSFHHAQQKTFTQELVYATNKLGRFQGTGGLFYFWNRGDMLPLDVNNYVQSIWTIDRTHAYAIFGELSYDLTDRLSIIGGLRYSWEKKKAYAAFTASSVQPTLPLLGEKSWHSTTPRASVKYKASESTNLYFTYSEGFRSGVFNTVAFQRTPVDPEKVKSYEVGFKSRIGNSVTLNGAAFLYDYTGLQIPTIQQVGAAFTQVLTNAATAKIKGVELNGTWNVTNEFSLLFGATYLHARYTHFPNAVVNIPTGHGGNVSVQRDVSGNTMIGAPEWTSNITGRYVLDTSHGQFEAAGTLYYTSKVYFDVGDRVAQPAYARLDATLTWRPPAANWQLRVWGRNLTDRDILQSTTITTTGDTVNYSAPRTFGVEAVYSF
jgi:iron complex outermembrane receptor protein